MRIGSHQPILLSKLGRQSLKFSITWMILAFLWTIKNYSKAVA